jgi:AcrR family transcriptional regulator
MTERQPKQRPSRTEIPHRRDREVLAAAGKIFYARGYANATVQDVADELGILKGSLYHYIDNKEDLLFRLFQEIHQDGVELILEPVEEAEDLDALARLELFVRLQAEFNLEHLERIAVYHNDFDRLGPERRTDLLERRRRHEGLFISLLVDVDREVGIAMDPALASKLAYGAFIWVYRWYDTEGRLSRAEMVDTCSTFVLRGILGDWPVRTAVGSSARAEKSVL